MRCYGHIEPKLPENYGSLFKKKNQFMLLEEDKVDQGTLTQKMLDYQAQQKSK